MFITLRSYKTLTRVCTYTRMDRDDPETYEIVLQHDDPVSLFGKVLDVTLTGDIKRVMTLEEFTEMLSSMERVYTSGYREFDISFYTYAKAVTQESLQKCTEEIYTLFLAEEANDRDILNIMHFYFQWQDTPEKGFELYTRAGVYLDYHMPDLSLVIIKPYSKVHIRFNGKEMSIQTASSPVYGL